MVVVGEFLLPYVDAYWGIFLTSVVQSGWAVMHLKTVGRGYTGFVPCLSEFKSKCLETDVSVMLDVSEEFFKACNEHFLGFSNILFFAFIAFQEVNDFACIAINVFI